MATLEPVAGGTVGVGATVALRETVDERGGMLGKPGSLLDRLTRPSVLAGVGGGVITGALWYLDNERIYNTTPFGVDRSFWGTHALTAISSGAASALYPKPASSGSGGTQTKTQTRTLSPTNTEPAGGSQPADAGGSGDSRYDEAR